MNVADELEASVSRDARHAAVLGPGQRTTSYGDLWTDVVQCERALRECGLQPRMCIGLHYPSGYDYIVLTYAIWRCGACTVPIAVELTAEEKRQICQEIQVDYVLTSKKHARVFPGAEQGMNLNLLQGQQLLIKNMLRVSHPVGFGDLNPAFVRFTSGTTGESKGVVLSHESVIDRIRAANDTLGINQHDRVLWLLSMSYHFTVSIVAYLSFGASIVLCKNHFGRTIVQAAIENDVTLAYGSPTHYDLMTQASGKGTLNSLRLALSTATALRADIADAFRARFRTQLNQAYGIIEVGLPCINTTNCVDKIRSVGRPTPRFAVKLEDVGLGSNSMAIMVRGPGMLDAYYVPWTSRSSILEDGWFRTGDLGWIDEDGFLFITGRSKEVISIGGMKFFPQEVERVLEAHPVVRNACVMRQKDGRMGDMAFARVVLIHGAALVNENDLKTFCRKRLAAYKVPTRIEFVDELAWTASGKLRRTTEDVGEREN